MKINRNHDCYVLSSGSGRKKEIILHSLNTHEIIHIYFFSSSDNIVGTKQHVVLCINFHFLPSPLCMLVAYPMGAGTYLVIETFQLNGKRMKRS